MVDFSHKWQEKRSELEVTILNSLNINEFLTELVATQVIQQA